MFEVAHGIKDLGGPFVIFRADDKNLKAVLDAFEPHSFGIINVQINPKSGWALRERMREILQRKLSAMAVVVDDAIGAKAMKQEPQPNVER